MTLKPRLVANCIIIVERIGIILILCVLLWRVQLLTSDKKIVLLLISVVLCAAVVNRFFIKPLRNRNAVNVESVLSAYYDYDYKDIKELQFSPNAMKLILFLLSAVLIINGILIARNILVDSFGISLFLMIVVEVFCYKILTNLIKSKLHFS